MRHSTGVLNGIENISNCRSEKISEHVSILCAYFFSVNFLFIQVLLPVYFLLPVLLQFYKFYYQFISFITSFST